ncbi:MAG: thiamine pyrophosphate-dependent dehydrogenase E1 component subunit alpha, partial [Bdellovibrionales bacterium]|nr:thiamine pyrophosphate-dependent dehydrogenase E1 component subunit alpha [Bdellovibrionales bacterium]
FFFCLVWASRKGQELPMLITVQNNGWGISTAFEGQHGETHVADRGKAFNMRTAVINGNDPIETYIRLQEELAYIRKTGKPVLMEAKVSRLYGHSSASGASFIPEEDGLKIFSEKLLKHDLISEEEIKNIYDKYEAEGVAAQEQARGEPVPQPEDIWKHVYVNNENADWRKF